MPTVPKPPPGHKPQPIFAEGDIVYFKLHGAIGVQVMKAMEVLPNVVGFSSRNSSVVFRYAREDFRVYRVQTYWPDLE